MLRRSQLVDEIKNIWRAQQTNKFYFRLSEGLCKKDFLSKPNQSLALTWYDFMEAVTVAQEVVALKPLWPLTQGPTLHVCFVVLHQSLLKQSNGPFIVAVIVQPHCCREGALRWRPDRGSWERGKMGRVGLNFSVSTCLSFTATDKNAPP